TWEACAFSREPSRKSLASSSISPNRSRADPPSILTQKGLYSTAKPRPKRLVWATVIRSLFALNSIRGPCAFTACPTFETEGWLAAAQHLRTACAYVPVNGKDLPDLKSL